MSSELQGGFFDFMSKYMTFESQSFPNGELLLEALSDIGFATVTQGKDLPLDGWDKRNARTADIIVRRRDVKNNHLLADIGFQKTNFVDSDHRRISLSIFIFKVYEHFAHTVIPSAKW